MKPDEYNYGRAPRAPEPNPDDEHWTPEAIAERNRQLREVNGKLNADFAAKFPETWGERKTFNR